MFYNYYYHNNSNKRLFSSFDRRLPLYQRRRKNNILHPVLGLGPLASETTLELWTSITLFSRSVLLSAYCTAHPRPPTPTLLVLQNPRERYPTLPTLPTPTILASFHMPPTMPAEQQREQ